MKQYRAIFIAIVILTAVFAAVLISRKDVCEIHISSILMEVAAFMDYEPR
ncbi:Hok/Gef family protein [[Erwinia] mediterraneensis]|nr:Hok/Gef family protein [[Erwinia] mediterraneensis]